MLLFLSPTDRRQKGKKVVSRYFSLLRSRKIPFIWRSHIERDFLDEMEKNIYCNWLLVVIFWPPWEMEKAKVSLEPGVGGGCNRRVEKGERYLAPGIEKSSPLNDYLTRSQSWKD